ncbi:MAG: hypothetical protein H7833_14010 [Magnetococcus sp. DMHC-1]|nr:hypothetical protein [Magnetococcales bacterium]
MMAVELKASICDHQMTIASDHLPAHASHVRVIVLYDENIEQQQQSSTNNQELLADIISKQKNRKKEMAQALAAYRLPLSDYKFDRDEANAR